MKTCESCGHQFAKKPKVTYAQWARQRYCSVECRNSWAASVARVIAGDSRLTIHGYRQLYLPMHPAAKSSYVYEHRIVMEQKLGRLLASHEYVHHINEDTLDNRPENLQIVSSSKHRVIHFGTPSDDDVAALIRQGRTSREIAALGVSTHRIVRVRREAVA